MALLRSIRHPLRRFGQVDGQRRALVVEAVASLLLARLALVFLPFPRIAQRLGRFVPPGEARAAEAQVTPSREQTQLAQQVGWAVTRSARYVPFRAVCLPQAMAARAMLKRRGVASTLHFGAAKGTDMPIDTHAWLYAAGVEVTGYPVADEFAEIGCLI